MKRALQVGITGIVKTSNNDSHCHARESLECFSLAEVHGKSRPEAKCQKAEYLQDISVRHGNTSSTIIVALRTVCPLVP